MRLAPPTSLVPHVAAAATALLAATAAAAATPASPTAATVHTLPNGLTVVIEEQHRTDQVALFLRYGVGSRDEGVGEHGCAHLFEHLMFEGSANVPTNMFDTWLTAGGGDNNAYTSEDETVYHMTFPSGALDLALFLESDRMGFLDAGLDAANLANQQKVVLQERRQGYAEPHGRDSDVVSRVLYPEGHPYHVPVIGTVADVEGFSLDGVLDFWQRHYRPRNAVLVLVGNVDTDAALASVTRWFADVPDPGPAVARVDGPTPPAVPADALVIDEVDDRSVTLAWRTVPLGHPDEPALDVLSYVLDNGRGTRLADALYYKHPLASAFGVWSGMSAIDGTFQVDVTSAGPPLPRLVKVIDATLARVVRKPPSQEEVDRARKALLAGIEDTLETPEGRAGLLLYCHDTYGDPNCLGPELARYEAVTPADVARVAGTWLAPEARVTLSVVADGDGGSLPGAAPVELP
ncbi:MAG: insulinase family protein [Alphaproteobacteria bacterium]|nr:insulinase family protein [Alphaproteobacteria bacterium]